MFAPIAEETLLMVVRLMGVITPQFYVKLVAIDRVMNLVNTKEK